MGHPYLSQIGMFGGRFAPKGHALCQGQVLGIAGNSALFSLLRTTYGGDGRTSFALPDLRGRLPMHFGAGPDLTPRVQGASVGTETVALTVDETPAHDHAMQASLDPAGSNDPTDRVVAPGDTAGVNLDQFTATAPTEAMAGEALADAGDNQGHDNLMPLIAINFIIALQGAYPSRN